MSQEDFLRECTNCGHELQTSDIFCAHCGQKVEQSRISFREMISIFLYALFNADSTLWRTLKHLWIPGKLTREYFSGKRKSYLHPVRLFLFSWVLFFAVFAFSNQMSPDDSLMINLYQLVEKRVTNKNTVNHLLEKRDFWKDESRDSTMIKALGDMVLSTAAQLDDNWKVDNIDSLKNILESTRDSFNVTLFSPTSLELSIAYEDIIKMTDEELFESYQIDGFINKVVATQALKIFRDTSGMVQYLIRGFSWMVLFTIPIMSLLLYVMYFYRKHFMVEHLVFLLHIHSLFFISFLFVALLHWVYSTTTGLFGGEAGNLLTLYALAGIYALVYPLIGFRVFYKSSIPGVLIKGFFFLLAYFSVSVGSLTIAMILRFLLF